MPQIFHPSTNTIAKASVFGGLLLIAAAVYAGNAFLRSSYVTQVDVVRDQPVPFSHDHHVSGLGIDCRYCHSTVETSAFAGMPATEVCMGCHSQIWKDSPLLAPLRESHRTGKPLAWTRVYDVPDFVYFNHSIHVAKGIACQSCHGPVDRMPLTPLSPIPRGFDFRAAAGSSGAASKSTHRRPNSRSCSIASFPASSISGMTRSDGDGF